MKITASIRAILYLSFFLYADITSTVIPLSSQSISQGTFTRIEHRRFPSSVAPKVARPQRSSRLNAVPSESNGIPEDQSKFVPFMFRDVVKMSPSSVQQESCAPSPLANQLSEACPFDSNNLEELGLEFIGWHGDVLENVDSLQEKIVISSEPAVATGDAVSQPKKGRLGDGFYVRDELMAARHQAELARLQCLRRFAGLDEENQNEKDCNYAMCAIFARKDWWKRAKKVVVSRHSPNYWMEGVPKQLVSDYMKQKRLSDDPIVFGHMYRRGTQMEAKFDSRHTRHLVAVCTYDNIAHKLLEENPNFGAMGITKTTTPPEALIDTVPRFFGSYYSGMSKMRYQWNLVNWEFQPTITTAWDVSVIGAEKWM